MVDIVGIAVDIVDITVDIVDIAVDIVDIAVYIVDICLPECGHGGVCVGVAGAAAPPCELHVDVEAELLLEVEVVPGEGLHLQDRLVSGMGYR